MSGVLQLLVIVVVLYLLVGAGAAVWFVLVGAGRRDPAAADASLRVRLILAPGAIAIWPVLLLGGRQAGPLRTPQRVADLRARHALTWWLLGPVLLGATVGLLALRPAAPPPSNPNVPGAQP